jgi:hypothetical protein
MIEKGLYQSAASRKQRRRRERDNEVVKQKALKGGNLLVL